MTINMDIKRKKRNNFNDYNANRRKKLTTMTTLEKYWNDESVLKEIFIPKGITPNKELLDSADNVEFNILGNPLDLDPPTPIINVYKKDKCFQFFYTATDEQKKAILKFLNYNAYNWMYATYSDSDKESIKKKMKPVEEKQVSYGDITFSKY